MEEVRNMFLGTMNGSTSGIRSSTHRNQRTEQTSNEQPGRERRSGGMGMPPRSARDVLRNNSMVMAPMYGTPFAPPSSVVVPGLERDMDNVDDSSMEDDLSEALDANAELPSSCSQVS